MVNFGAWIMSGVALGSLATVLAGVPWTTYIARRHTAPEIWRTALFHETNVVMTLLWTLLFLSEAVVAVYTPWWTQILLGVLFSGLGRLSPWLAQQYVAWRLRHSGTP